MSAYPETLAFAQRERDKIAAMSDLQIGAAIEFFGDVKLRHHYYGFLHDLRREQDRRIAAGSASNVDRCLSLQSKLRR